MNRVCVSSVTGCDYTSDSTVTGYDYTLRQS